MFPTETVYGLGASALHPDAAKKIYVAKGRPQDNPLIVHIANPEDAERYAYTTKLYYKVAEQYMPGPITFILKKRENIPDNVTGGLDTVAIRVPINIHAHRLIVKSGLPIAAPSANISGRPSATTAGHCVADLYGRVDVILDGGESNFGLESTIVRETDKGLRILRPGAITVEDLRNICDDVTVDPAVYEKFDGIPEAPGMKYRHYAPKADVIILDGSDKDVYDYLSDKRNCQILCYAEDVRLLSRSDAISVGSRLNPSEQAHVLFSCLRQYDEAGTIYARMPEKNGVGLAVFNRLIKAAGYHIIHL